MPNKNNNINLSNSDIQAIVCALPLVTYARTDSPDRFPGTIHDKRDVLHFRCP